jgi:cation:H+ antiporter
VTSLLLLVAGLVLVVGGAELFFDGVLAVARRLGVSAFVLTVLLAGLEVENLAAGIAANAKGLPDAAAGTFLGGATFLALGVAGAAALIAPIRAGLPGRVYALTALAPLPLLALAVDGTISRPDGGLLTAWSIVALFAVARSGGRREELPASRPRFGVVRLLAGLGLLTVGGAVLGEGVRRVVERFGVSEALLGNTVLAASVEAEEVARVVAPGRRGRGDVALANVLGTIVHFVAFNAGVMALVKPLELGEATLRLHLPAAAVSTALLALVAASRPVLGRLEGGLLLAAYAAYLTAAIWIA